ncbi:hypothetical protein KAR28_06710 [Candidatus Parcubacteria bacterium]|nr:hypothetical protein [Candidatus Parcubacteria bacterium]
MAIIRRCDKCKKTIKNEDRNKSLSFSSIGIGSDLINKDKISAGIELCPACSAPVAKYLTKYLKIKKKK